MNGFSGVTGRAFLRCIKRRRGHCQGVPIVMAELGAALISGPHSPMRGCVGIYRKGVLEIVDLIGLGSGRDPGL